MREKHRKASLLKRDALAEEQKIEKREKDRKVKQERRQRLKEMTKNHLTTFTSYILTQTNMYTPIQQTYSHTHTSLHQAFPHTNYIHPPYPNAHSDNNHLVVLTKESGSTKWGESTTYEPPSGGPLTCYYADF